MFGMLMETAITIFSLHILASTKDIAIPKFLLRFANRLLN